MMRFVLLLPLICGSLAVCGCASQQQTAYYVAAGTGEQRDRTGIVVYTDEAGREIRSGEVLLPFVKTLNVRPGQKLSLAVIGRSSGRFYTTQIDLGYKGAEHNTIARNRGAGQQEVKSGCVVGATPDKATAFQPESEIDDEALSPATVARSSAPAQPFHFASAKKPLPMTVDELQVQIFARDVENIKLLLNGGVNVNGRDKDGVTPLVFASELGGDAAIVGLLLDNGAEADLADAKGNTPLLSAVLLERSEKVQLLLERGADVNRKDAHGIPPLIAAAALGKTAIVQILLAKHPDLTVKNLNGYTALQMAVFNGHEETAQVLRDAGAKE